MVMVMYKIAKSNRIGNAIVNISDYLARRTTRRVLKTIESLTRKGNLPMTGISNLLNAILPLIAAGVIVSTGRKISPKSFRDSPYRPGYDKIYIGG